MIIKRLTVLCAGGSRFDIVSAMEISTGMHLGPYEIVGRVGVGGMGEVYRARDHRLERDVAVKVLPRDLSANEKALSRFRREAKALAALSHPNILTVFDIGENEGLVYVVTELLEGQTLRQRIINSSMSWEKAVEIMTAVSEGLAAAHSHAIIHRDLKPENIFITVDERLKILDFGLAKRFVSEDLPIDSDLDTASQATADGTILGTAPYMSPEQARGDPLDPQSDIFSAGAVLYELLTGKMPFAGPNTAATIYKIIHENPPAPSTIRSELPPWLDQVTERALAKKKADRYSSAMELLKDLKRQPEPLRTEQAARWRSTSAPSAIRRSRIIIAIVVLLAVGLFGYRLFKRQVNIRRAREEALPEIERLIQENWRDFTEPYNLAKKAEEYIPDDPKLQELFLKCSLRISVETEPPGASIYMKEYKSPDKEWEFLGISPLEKVRVPIGIMRWKMEKEGYETTLAAGTTFDTGKSAGRQPVHLLRVLNRENTIPSGMVWVAGAETSSGKLDDFYIDRYEVTNRKYKEFVDSGGYTERKYWKHEFLKDGASLTWEDAMPEFVDRTNRPGPATWQGGDYPEGQGEYPVSGISWYEAAAYAEFTGKSLPTSDHWGLARGEATTLIQFPQIGGFAVFAPFSNFGGKGPVPVGSLPGITSYGAYDMAGNVREWCWNETEKGKLIRGGAWNDNTYAFQALSQSPPMDRSSKNGFRCALYPNSDKIPPAAFGMAKLPEVRDLHDVKPVPDTVFQIYREQFSYDKTDLNARIESRIERPGSWMYEKITLDAAYAGERIVAYLFLPEIASPPYQTVVYYPGVGAIFQETSKDIENYFEFPVFLSFIVKNGRAVLFPVYKGTFERRDDTFTELHVRKEINSYLWAEYLTEQIKDLKRSIDYLETRQDIDSEKLAYYGMSWGGWLGAMIPSVEKRLQASILIPGGFVKEVPRPEVDPINYIARVTVPTLMLNGRYDTVFPYETSAKPFYDLLGTPPEHKELKLYETDHIPPRNEFIKETLAWLDRYLGPVKR